MIRSLIVDDEMLARQRLRRLLEDHPDIEVAGECANGLEAVRALELIETVASPGMSGLLRQVGGFFHAVVPRL